VSITTPPGRPEIEQDRDLEQRVADLEALIEEARRRARRRRQRNWGAALLVAAAVVGLLIGFGGRGGGGAGTAATAHAPGAKAPAANADSAPLGVLPPDTGRAESFAFDPRNPEIVYVLTNGGGLGTPVPTHVFKTTDGGQLWHATATGGRGWVGGREALAADPRHPGTLYAGTELAVYKTVDGGRIWRPSKRGLIAPPRRDRDKGWVLALAVDPADTNVVYAGSDRVSKSTDGGRSWKTVFPPHAAPNRETVSALALAPSRPEAIYAITGDFGPVSSTPADGRTTIYKSNDAGTTWQATTVVRGSVAPTVLAVDPRDPTTVYAAIGAKVMKTTNAGKTWQPIAHGLPISDTRGTCQCLSQGGVTALAVDPRRSGTVYAALTQGGIYKTTDGGQTWTRALNTTLSLDAVAVDPAHPATIYAAGEGQCGPTAQSCSSPSPANELWILRSTNSGHTWATAP